jgi:hypothetical protein
MEHYKNLSLESLFYINEEGLVCLEEWRDILGYENRYQISNLGRIKSLHRFVNSGNKLKPIKEIILLQTLNERGYLRISLRKEGIKKALQFSVHRALAIAFIPNPLNLPEVNHKKGNKQDNRFFMLEWNTRSENAQHAYDNGLIKPNLGEKHQMSKFTEKQVLEIREIHKDKSIFYSETAIKYNISSSMIGLIVRRKSWTHI